MDINYDIYENSIMELSSSIFSHFGIKVSSKTMDLKLKKRVCFILLDGLGWNIYERTGIKMEPMKINTVFPSTTANVLASIFLNMYPGEHGIIGYQVYIKELGSIINTLGYTSSSAYIRDSMEKAIPIKKIFNFESAMERLINNGTDVVNIIPSNINHSSYSNLIYGNVQSQSYNTFYHGLRLLERELKSGHDLISFYAPYVDLVAHKLGPYDDYTIESARYILSMIKRISEKYTDYTFLITADHGHIEVSDIINLNEDKSLSDMLLLPPFGDARVLFFYNDVSSYINDNYHEMLIFKRSENYKNMLGRINNRINLPEIITAATSNNIYHYSLNEREYRMLGAHSSLLPEEMEIPLIYL
ncbi:alkaline phosphatase family protein [Picrophilus oshimae]|uniref:Nucleotide pyrophosphatase/phosphodiesterase I n=1 Tax=Picrophilus torridus (strain ATCC 700027 / DSM 9790 / JCM 10055 / NBRC 100828 / KAW 2/3) TaxID=1122961 RepID=Q6L064_PICTO|nr:alkaline phosphatase family protein [Picrophilus oshimae]AAT43638.1 nucleotide pyrophosphatase/phosphodiesterase I [Picrophilus oshimae DSM 9789]